MKKTNSISQLMLERYHRGTVSAKERKLVEKAKKLDAELRQRHAELQKSEENLRLLFPLEKLPRLAAVKDAVIPVSITEPFSKEKVGKEQPSAKRRGFPETGTARKWSREKKLKWGFGAAAVFLCVFFSVFYFLIWHNSYFLTDKPSLELAGLEARARELAELREDSSVYFSLPPDDTASNDAVLAYDDSIRGRSVLRSESFFNNWEGTGYAPQGPAGIEGQVPPSFKDIDGLDWKITQGRLPLNEDFNAGSFNTSEFDHLTDNPFRRVTDSPLSTFSIDVDTAGYSIVRYFLTNRQRPPKSAVRIEELVNYFDYAYPPPMDGKPFAAHIETAAAPWNPMHLLARIAVKGREFPAAERPKVNLVFLLDVSGSMDEPNRLPLVISSIKMLVNELNSDDTAAICVYAGAAGTVLPPTSGNAKNKILAALDTLQAGGSTAGGAGIQLAYQLAQQNFDPGAVNRVILCTDGDFNVGISSRSELVDLIAEKAKSGVYLTVLGFGMDNYRDGTLKQLASKGNGNYGYIDTIEEARKILIEQLSGTLITIANDVKIQVEFNPATVGTYRLIGYENRLLRKEDFNDDTVDAGDIGAGHTVTAFYELIPLGAEIDALPSTDPLKYGSQVAWPGAYQDELLTVKLRYKLPQESKSSLLSIPVAVSSVRKTGEESADFNFAAAVAGFGMLLRDSPYKGNADFDSIFKMAQNAIGPDTSGYRQNFLELIKKAQAIMPGSPGN
ncbi:MAG: VWA domain-containing protein [Treponema sp.]|nr:VWA domain-containing protein [Treponema sp.]